MKYRRLSDTGDYTFGAADQDFVYDIDATAQAIKTRLQLYRDSFWRDLPDGLPMFQNILGSRGSISNLAQVDGIIQQRISGTQNVQAITEFSSEFSRDSREYIFTANVQTTFSQNIIIQDSIA